MKSNKGHERKYSLTIMEPPYQQGGALVFERDVSTSMAFKVYDKLIVIVDSKLTRGKRMSQVQEFVERMGVR